MSHMSSYRPPREPPQKPKRSLMEVLFAQWPLFGGFALIGMGLGYVWYCKTYPPHILYTKPVIYLCTGGVVMIMYWAFANKNDNYNF
jgi:hypothetical protein